MLAVIGLEVNIASVMGTDAFDYHLYSNKLILSSGETRLKTYINNAIQLTDNLLSVNHLSHANANLIILNEANNAFTEKELAPLACRFSTMQVVCSMESGLSKAKEASKVNQSASLLISIHPHVNAVVALLLCDKSLLASQHVQFSLCHCYAEIESASFVHFTDENNPVSHHIQQFLTECNLQVQDIESVLLEQKTSALSSKQHQQDWLTAFTQQQCAQTEYSKAKTTLLTDLGCIDSSIRSANQFTGLLCLASSILCLDQAYRLGSRLRLVDADTHDQILHTAWQTSPYYYLGDSTSYLTSKNKLTRRMMVSYCTQNNHQLVLLRAASAHTNKNEILVVNGFLSQQSIKPLIVEAHDIEHLFVALSELVTFSEKRLMAEHQGSLSFSAFCQQRYEQYPPNCVSGYCVVLLADSFSSLIVQSQLALAGVEKAIIENHPWKTPAGSYFSGQVIAPTKSRKSVSFIYPGVGALYVNMGKDLLRLFPAAYQTLTSISDDLAMSLQDHLITPRLIMEPSFAQKVELDKMLRKKLVNIAEAGVSYACLLTAILQHQLVIKPTSAAGYSMGEVSMFAALGCWENPHQLSERLRASDTFTKQLVGPLNRLNNLWGSTSSDKPLRWESYHLKAGLLQVQSVITEFPRVYITIVNTSESLVIAGEPEQCLALAKQLKLRAIALNIPNIIHCDLAKSEYENMLALYSLTIKQKLTCQLFSSSCYLPIPITEKAIAMSISKCLTEFVDFPRLINKLYATGETVFIEVGAGKSLSTWIERILNNSVQPTTCLSVNQQNSDDYSAILKAIAPLISLGYPVNLQNFFKGSLIRPIKKITVPV